VIVDPSHAAGVRSLVIPLSLGSLAAGADGLIVEVHPIPSKAVSRLGHRVWTCRVRGS
jgi:3-deoxy-7-phosphoheptulonate synthase